MESNALDVDAGGCPTGLRTRPLLDAFLTRRGMRRDGDAPWNSRRWTSWRWLPDQLPDAPGCGCVPDASWNAAQWKCAMGFKALDVMEVAARPASGRAWFWMRF